MGLSQEIEQLKRRTNKVAIHAKTPEIRMYVLGENDPDPDDFDLWSIVIRIEEQYDYYGEGDKPPLPVKE